MAYRVAEKTFSKYSCPKSPKTFTQAQLVACLVLKEFLHQDFRGLVGVLRDAPDWRKAIELKKIPSYSTFHKAQQRLLSGPHFEALMNSIIATAVESGVISKKIMLAAIDGSGLETHYSSRYYSRKKQQYARKNQNEEKCLARFPFYISVGDCKSHLILSAWVGEGPTYETRHLPHVLRSAKRRVSIDTILGDGGYDSEENHRICREQLNIKSIFPPINGRNKSVTTPPKGRYRRDMWRRFPRKIYRQRPQIETINSMLKHRLGSFLRGRQDGSRRNELRLKLFTINTMIV
jgi:hypothetical protein